MVLELTPEQRTDLEQAAAKARQTRTWKRYQALLLLADGQTIAQVCTALACGQSTIYRWVAIWRKAGVGRLVEGPHRGRAHRLDAAAAQVVQDLLGADPQTYGHHATGWTVPLLLGELATAGWVVHEHTLRRTLKRLGYRWKRPQYVLGRPDPAYAEKKGP
jgi:transposase